MIGAQLVQWRAEEHQVCIHCVELNGLSFFGWATQTLSGRRLSKTANNAVVTLHLQYLNVCHKQIIVLVIYSDFNAWRGPLSYSTRFHVKSKTEIEQPKGTFSITADHKLSWLYYIIYLNLTHKSFHCSNLLKRRSAKNSIFSHVTSEITWYFT